MNDLTNTTTQFKSSAYDFSFEIDQQIKSLSGEDYLLKTRHSKWLQQELYPLSRLGLHFKQPGLEVEVEAIYDCKKRDGCIRITGFYDKEFKVEITYAGYYYEAALRDELLVSKGVCPGTGEIKRNKKSKEIIATLGTVDFDEHFTRIASDVLKEFHAKNEKDYDPGMVLLIAFKEPYIYGRINWYKLFSVIDAKGGMSHSQFDYVYLFNGATNELFSVN